MLGLRHSVSGQHGILPKNGRADAIVIEVDPAKDEDHAKSISGGPNAEFMGTDPPNGFQSMVTSNGTDIKLKKTRTKAVTRASFAHYSSDHVKKQHTIIHEKCRRELGASVGNSYFDTSLDILLQWIRSERLARLPHKGGSWDRVLIAAQCFADQVQSFAQGIETFSTESVVASKLVYGHCLLLLELGHENAAALEEVFNMFYEFGLDLTPLLKQTEMFAFSQTICDSSAKAFGDLLAIVTGIAISLYHAVHSGRASVAIEIYSTFGSLITAFRMSVAQCAKEMWNLCLRSENLTKDCNVDILQRWLAPHDSVLAFLAASHINLANRPEQFTCTWFQQYLTTFIKGDHKTLLVEGKSGSGKTTLAHWVMDRLHRPVARRQVSSLAFFFDPNIIGQSTGFTMIKTLLHQLFAQRIGDANVFYAIRQAFQTSTNVSDVEQQENKLWRALTDALQAINKTDDDPIVIIVDGISSIQEGKPGIKKLRKRLLDLSEAVENVKIILFSEASDFDSSNPNRVKLSHDTISNDLRAIVNQSLSAAGHFDERGYDEQDRIIEQLVDAAAESMLWASMVCQALRLSKDRTDFNDKLKVLLASPKTVAEVLKTLLPMIELDQDSKSFLSILMAAERPLLLPEIHCLLHGHQLNNKSEVRKVLRSLGPLTVVGKGLVCMRHNSITQALAATTSPNLLQLKDRHTDMLKRLLVYAQNCSLGEKELNIGDVEWKTAESKLSSYQLLEYAARYWAIHFRASSYFKPTGDMDLSKELSGIFPASLTFALLEQACWIGQSSLQEAVELSILSYRVRQATFGQTHLCVLQTALSCAHLYQKELNHSHDAVAWYSRASKISKVVLGAQAEMTVVVCNLLLQISESLITKKRNELMTYREEAFLLLITAYSHRFGEHSEEVLEIYQKLIELYVSIDEEHKATTIRTKVKTITIALYGSAPEEAHTITESMDIELRGHTRADSIETYKKSLFLDYQEEREEEFSLIRIEILLKLASEHIQRGAFREAEEIYVELWLKISEYCQIKHVLEWHEKKLQVMLVYAEFLQSQKRTSEACAILLCIHREYYSHEFASAESIILLLNRVALCMKSAGLLTTALIIFRKCWSYFKGSHKEENGSFREIEEHLTITSREIARTTTETTTTTSSEIIIKEVFQSSMSNTETQVTTTTIELCKSLSSTYIKQERWSEAITCIESVLRKSWASFFLDTVESTLITTNFTKENTELAEKLAFCYIAQRLFDRVEQIYLRLYRVHRKVHKIDHASVTKYIELILAFYKEHKYFSKAINFYQELLVEYRTFYGNANHLTIKVLYELGSLCREHYLTHGYWIEYYLEIVTALNRGSEICHEQALEALVVVSDYYHEVMRYSESLTFFKCLFATFCKFGTKYKYFENQVRVETILTHYFRCLEESKLVIVDYIAIIKELREACIKSYGATSSISILTTSTLAEICCRSEHHEIEAISFIKEVLQQSTSVSMEVKKHMQTTLSTLYVKQVTKTDSTSTVSLEMVEKATTVVYERYVETRKKFSCTHETVLNHLKELVTLYHRQKKTDLAIKEIKNLLIDCVKVTSAKELTESATFFAEIFIACEYHKHALELARELKLQIIYKSKANLESCGFNVTTYGRECLVFIAAFELRLRMDSGLTFAALLADLIAEFLYYERFVLAIQKQSKLHAVFLSGARIRQVLIRTGRMEDFHIVQKQVIDYFTKTEAAVVKAASHDAIKVFVDIVLQYICEQRASATFTSAAGQAAVRRLRFLLKEHRHKEALELTKCTFKFLMMHEGLDDPTEITLGFQLALFMGGRGENNPKCSDATLQKTMLTLSREILHEVFDICKKSKISLKKCELSELNELIVLVGEQKDYPRLHWLLHGLWTKREGQTSWPQAVVLALGKRLVEVEFILGHHSQAIRLCEDIVYNVRRVHGRRHHNALAFQGLLAQLYTSLALHHQQQSGAAEATLKKRWADLARTNFRKAIDMHEEILRLLVEPEAFDNSDDDDDDDFDSEFSTSSGGDGTGRTNAITFQPICGFVPRSLAVKMSDTGNESHLTVQLLDDSPSKFVEEHKLEIATVRRHIRLLKLAMQRYGGWGKQVHEYDRLTEKVWSGYAKELHLKENEVLAKKWKLEGYGAGKAEMDVSEDGFVIPHSWELA